MEEEKRKVGKKAKRTSEQMRQDNLAMGAIRMKLSPQTSWKPLGMYVDKDDRIVTEMTTKGVTWKGNAVEEGAREKVNGRWRNTPSRYDQYRVVERKGFRVTMDTGCILPDDYYSTAAEGASLKGYQRAFFAFSGKFPRTYKEAEPKDSLNRSDGAQLSHLCHRHSCLRPDHVVIEPRWRNVQRNGCPKCGANPLVGGKGFTCGCNLQYEWAGTGVENGPPCVREYTIEAVEPEMAKNQEDVREVLSRTNFPFDYSFVDYAPKATIETYFNAQQERPRSPVEPNRVPKDTQLSPVVCARQSVGLASTLVQVPVFSKKPSASVIAMLAEEEVPEDVEDTPFD
jgi:hypothetical protein